MEQHRSRRPRPQHVMAIAVASIVGAVLVLGIAGRAVSDRDDDPHPAVLPPPPSASGTTAVTAGEPPTPARPDIVLVQMDDFSLDLLPTMEHAAEMARRGATFTHSFVVDSLCCVSRSSTFTGQYPHQTGVLTNSGKQDFPGGPIGGWEAFRQHGNAERTFALNLQAAGYTTGYVGKFLNEYEYRHETGEVPEAPPGWSDLRILFGSAYDGWDFHGTYVEDGQMHVREYPAPPASATRREKDRAYAGHVIARDALDFIGDHADDEEPYFLQVAPYAPHSHVSGPHYTGDPLFPAAFRDRPRPGNAGGNCGPVACSELGVEDLPGYGDDRSDNQPRRADGSVAPSWNAEPGNLPVAAAESGLRNRARMVQSVDRMLGEILDAVDEDTYVVLTSDNGFHLGQFGLRRGKGTAYDADTRVPLIVVGPGVEPGTRDDVVSNLDLAPTFEDLAGARTPAYRSGRSLVPALMGDRRRKAGYVFFEHTWSQASPTDPDRPFTDGGLDVIPSYVAVRSRSALLIRNDLDPSWDGADPAYEFYDLGTDPGALTNRYGEPRYADQVARLTAKLEAFDRCSRFTRDDAVPRRCRALTLE